MSRRLTTSRAAKAVVLHASNPIDGISQNISLSNQVDAEVDASRLWFIPGVVSLPPRVQQGASHARNKKHTSDQTKPYIPRPRNVFFRFKSLFVKQKVLPSHIPFVNNSCQISTIAAYVWSALPEGDKAAFRAHEDEEQRAHQRLHPQYELKPSKATKIKASTKKSPNSKIEMKPEKRACREIADLVLGNLQGEELANGIKKIVKTTLPPNWEPPKPRKDRNPSSKVLARPMPKSRLPSKAKGRSSMSKAKQSKASLDRTYVGLVNRRQSQTAIRYSEEVSDDEDEEVSSDSDVEYHTSQCSMPPPSLTSQDVSMTSGTQISTPSRQCSPNIVEDPFDCRNDPVVHQPPFDSSFAPFQYNYTPTSEDSPHYDSLNVPFPSGLPSLYPFRYSDRGVEDCPTPGAEYLLQDFVETQQRTIDPRLLHI